MPILVSYMTQIWVTWKKIDTISYCCCIDNFPSYFTCLDSCKNWKGLKFTISTQSFSGKNLRFRWGVFLGNLSGTKVLDKKRRIPRAQAPLTNGWWKWLIRKIKVTRKTNKKGQHLNPKSRNRWDKAGIFGTWQLQVQKTSSDACMVGYHWAPIEYPKFKIKAKNYSK